MKTSRLILLMLFSSVLGGSIAVTGFIWLGPSPSPESIAEKQQVRFSNFENNEPASALAEKTELPKAAPAQKDTPSKALAVPDGLNFISAAEKATPAVVHIQTVYEGNASAYGRNSFEDMFEEYFGDQYQYRGRKGPRVSSGSGVIITEDGYIATNFHVVEDANKVEVILEDKRSYPATVVGTDPTTDLALLKIEEAHLPFIPFGNSDEVKIGQWVLAVGNPFDLTSTVTAGIVSAKARNINILRSRTNLSIESFIQTDAAVNPGNSGGALIDLNGDLIGINTAIATTTGSYSGYSFAVPVTLVSKVMDDLVNYGEVQRALMGVSIVNIDASLAERESLGDIEGVFIAGVAPNGGADEAGVRRGDILLSVEGKEVNTVSALQELVARNRPGDLIDVEIKRGKKYLKFEIELKNRNNTTEIVRAAKPNLPVNSELLGAELRELSQNEKDNLGLLHGIRVERLGEGRLKASKVQEGFIITHIDKEPIMNLEELEEALKGKIGGVLIEGMYQDGERAFYGIGLGEEE